MSSNFELKAEEITTTQEEIRHSEAKYVLGCVKGHLSVFRDGENTPIIVTQTMVENLPKEDQKNLLSGIKITGDTTLRKALEDYCS